MRGADGTDVGSTAGSQGKGEWLSRSLPEGPSSGPAAWTTEFRHPARSDSGPGPSPSGFKREPPHTAPLALSLWGSAQFRCPPFHRHIEPFQIFVRLEATATFEIAARTVEA
jgi:hypothetical protein